MVGPRVLLLLAACWTHAVALVYTPPLPAAPVRSLALRSTSPRCAGSEDEIAVLREKLARLEAEAVAEEKAVAEEEVPSPTEPPLAGVEVQEGFDLATFSSRKKVAAIKDAAPIELLSESWKEEEQPEGGGALGLPQLAGGLVLLVALIFFAQVPIGADTVDSVTYGGKQTRVETPAEIRARYERIDSD